MARLLDITPTPRVTMPPELEPVHDDDYVSEEDSDFALDDAPVEDSSVSDDDDEVAADAQKPATAKPKQRAEDGADDAGFENSGDEAIIEKGKSRQRKANRKGVEVDEDEDEGGEGGFVKTRRMRAVEYVAQLSCAVNCRSWY
jgi:hypothetical protein